MKNLFLNILTFILFFILVLVYGITVVISAILTKISSMLFGDRFKEYKIGLIIISIYASAVIVAIFIGGLIKHAFG